MAIMCLLVTGSCTRQEPVTTAYLDAANEVGTWMINQADAQNRIPDVAGDTTYSGSLGAGAGGRAVFFLELYEATGNTAYLTWAKRESETMVSLSLAAIERGEFRAGLYSGLAGDTFVLSALQLISGETSHEETLSEMAQLMAEAGRETLVNDVIVGSSGVGIALLNLASEEDDALLSMATAIGDSLLSRAIPDNGGIYWMRAENMAFNLPNFSHGAAGIGYYLARLYETTRQSRFLEGAEHAAQYLMQVADQTDGLFLIPYGIPNEGLSTPYDIGWAHGPAGSARLFNQLWLLTGNRVYRDAIDAHVRSLQASGIPDVFTDSTRWAGPVRIDQRFGTSGVATFLLYEYRKNGNTEALQLARTLVNDLIDKSSLSASGRYWVLPKYGFQGGDGEASYTGYFYGAAGLGMALLDMHYVDIGSAPGIVFPDHVFANVAPDHHE